MVTIKDDFRNRAGIYRDAGVEFGGIFFLGILNEAAAGGSKPGYFPVFDYFSNEFSPHRISEK